MRHTGKHTGDAGVIGKIGNRIHVFDMRRAQHQPFCDEDGAVQLVGQVGSLCILQAGRQICVTASSFATACVVTIFFQNFDNHFSFLQSVSFEAHLV